VEELNRVPEETLNTLITVMSERELSVPRLGRVVAAAGFRLVAAMNPFDAVGTARISSAVYDRTCRVVLGYQEAADEIRVVGAVVAAEGVAVPPGEWVAAVVELVRRTRTHPDVRAGSSVRGAIDLVLVASSLTRFRAVAVDDPATTLDAGLVALSGRLRLREGSGRSAEDVIRELWAELFGPAGSDGDGTARRGKGSAPVTTRG